mgnify:CR=1 FL=1
MNMIDKDKVFDLFSNEMGNDSLSIDDLMKDPLSKIGMFVKLIQNHEIFHKKLNQFLSKENPNYDIEQTKNASMFTVYNRAWFYINQIDLTDKNHLDAILDGTLENKLKPSNSNASNQLIIYAASSSAPYGNPRPENAR